MRGAKTVLEKGNIKKYKWIIIQQIVDIDNKLCYSNSEKRKGGNAMLTNFGKALRKMRIDHEEFLKDMAKKLNVTVAYLSAVENGNRDVPDAWVNKLAESYNLSKEERKQLQNYAYEGKNSIKIDFAGMNEEEKEIALAFARSFPRLSAEDKNMMKKIFNNCWESD